MMAGARIKELEVKGFRAFGTKAQSLPFASKIAVVLGSNSNGKTSLAEAFEFLLTGQVARRELVGSAQDEFAESLRNVHMSTDENVYVAAVVVAPDGNEYAVKRTLISDYPKRGDCETLLEIDGKRVAQDALAKIGLVLSQPPLQSPVLAQHTLGYLFSALPKERATYFKTLLELTDLDRFRGEVAALDVELAPVDTVLKQKLSAALGVTVVKDSLSLALERSRSVDETRDALSDAVGALLTAAGAAVSESREERIASAESTLQTRRAKTFPMQVFDVVPLSAWMLPGADVWGALALLLEERAKVDEEARQLASLFREALQLPALQEAVEPRDCPLCEGERTLTVERVAFLRTLVEESAAYQEAGRNATRAWEVLLGNARELERLADNAGPQLLATGREKRIRMGIRLKRVRTVLGDDGTSLVPAWIAALRVLARERRRLKALARAAHRVVEEKRETLRGNDEVEAVREAFESAGRAYAALLQAVENYREPAGAVVGKLRTVVDAESKTTGWQELIELARRADELQEALLLERARKAVQDELGKCLKEIDRGIEAVLEEKFAELSTSVLQWWELLRPGEPTFFASVQPRPGARRTIDLKAGLSVSDQRTEPKIRDVVAVFSQSQLHCLGLALFLARATREGSGFVVLDDPVLSSDEDYRACFEDAVLERLIQSGVQVILLTQLQKMSKNLGTRYAHESIDMFQITLVDRVAGAEIVNEADDLGTLLQRADVLARGEHPKLRKDAGQVIRDAIERFCKELLVASRQAKGERNASISDYDGKNPADLVATTEALLGTDASHPGKLRAALSDVSSAKHDDDIPSRLTLRNALGTMRMLKKEYLKGKTRRP